MDPFLQHLLAYQQAHAHAHPQKAAYPPYPGYYNEDPYGAYSFAGGNGGYPRGYPPRRAYGGYGGYGQPASSYFNARGVPAAYYGAGEDEEDSDEEEDKVTAAKNAALLAGLGFTGDDGQSAEQEDVNEDVEEDDEDNDDAEDGSAGYQFGGLPVRGASSSYPNGVFYFSRPKPKPKAQPRVVAPSGYSGLPIGGSAVPVPAEPAFGAFDPSAFAARNKRQRQQKQPMYVMDRYGNLYPYQPAAAAAPEGYPSERRDIDANQLIRMLLGAGDQKDAETESKKPEEEGLKATGEDDTQQRDLEAAAISKAISDELEAEARLAKEQEQDKQPKDTESAASLKPIEETPLTREGLADILSQLAQSEESKSSFQPPFAEASGIAPPSVIPVPQKLRRRSTAPSLNVHKADKTVDDSASSTSAKKPTVVADVKVSAPQLKKKNLPFSPPLNVYEFKTKYIVVISLPGVSKEFVEIDYHPTSNELIIKGEAKNKYLSDDDEAANSFVLKVSEQRFGNFERIVKLPAYPGIEDTQIKAKFLNGLLEIKLPKVDESTLQKEAKKIVLEDVPDEELERESGKGYI